ncbi:MAG: methyltransferase domain-containing protein [Candidatus Acidiferrales bacterium]
MISWPHLLCCPFCRGDLSQPDAHQLQCLACRRKFPVVLDIPDLRVAPDPYIGFDEERAKVEKLAARFADFDFEGFVDFYYGITSVVPPKHAQQYKRGLMVGVARAESWLQAWESELRHSTASPATAEPQASLLEIGCGTGPLLVAAKNYAARIGVDIALRWLVVAKKRLEQARLGVPLVCACAEALPFRDGTFDRVVCDSALEHFRDPREALAQMHRVMRPHAALFIATPNRFSIGPDPQTGIPAGSLLPDAWTAAIVTRQGGIPPKRRLLSAGTLCKLLADAGFRDIRLFLPAIPAAQRAHFSALMRAAIAAYDLARRAPFSRHLLRLIGPLFQAVARKP